MARIPDQLDLGTLAGSPLPMEAPAPTDFGLDAAASATERVAVQNRRLGLLNVRVQAAQAKQQAQPSVDQLQGQNEEGLASDAAAFQGGPGFVGDQVSKATKRAQDISDSLAVQGVAPAVQSEFATAAAAQTNRVALAAAAHQAQVNAAPIAQAALNQKNSQINGAITDYNTAFAPAKQALTQAWVAGDTDLPTKIAGAFDDASQAAIAKLPAALQPEATAKLQSQRVTEVADAQDFQLTHQLAAVAGAADRQINAGVNTIVGAPANYDTFVKTTLPGIVATLPAGAQTAATHDGRGQAAEARIRGLIQAGETQQAKSELTGGLYDADLKPGLKESLMAAVAGSGPDAIAQAAASARAQERLGADIDAQVTTGHSILAPGELNADVAAGLISADQAGEHIAKSEIAQRAFTGGTGAVAGMSNAQLTQAVSAPRPDPSDPDYVGKSQIWEAQQQAAAAEIKARSSPGNWAFANTSQSMGGQPMGAAMRAKWQAAQTGGAPAMADYASTMLQVQAQAGIAGPQRQIVPDAVAANLAATVETAPPEGKLKAMQGMAALVQSMPASVRLTDGTATSPRAMLLGQLVAGGMSAVEATALSDFAAPDKTAALGRAVAATTNPNNTAKAIGKQEAQLEAQVTGALAPYFRTTAPLPGAQAMQPGQTLRTVMVARNLMIGGMDMHGAVATAAGDLTGGYRLIDTWRMPVAAANTGGFFGGIMQSDGASQAKFGAAALLGDLTGNGGANLYSPAGIGRGVYAAQIHASGRWTTLPDESGLALTVPKPDGTWTQVTDKYGRPVQASWAQLEGAAQGRPSPFDTPPPNVTKGPDGTPVAAFSKSAGFGALSWAVEQGESRGVNGQVNPKSGAMGVMQVMPATVQRYAPQLGLPVDMGRATNDPAYNRQIGNAALGDLTNRYMTGANPAAGLGLALAAYNAGEGHLTGFKDAKGYHPGWLQTIGDPRSGKISLNDWVARIPFPETRAYVQDQLGRAVNHIQAQN